MWQAELGRRGNARSLSHVGNDKANLHAGKLAGTDGLGDGQKIRSAAGKQNAEPDEVSFHLPSLPSGKVTSAANPANPANSAVTCTVPGARPSPRGR